MSNGILVLTVDVPELNDQYFILGMIEFKATPQRG